VQSPRGPTISLRMTGSPPDASVVVDDLSIGQLDYVATRGVALPVGVHHVTVTAHGYFPWDREVEAKLGSPPITLDAKLEPIPD
jgi:hypothetical protein